MTISPTIIIVFYLFDYFKQHFYKEKVVKTVVQHFYDVIIVFMQFNHFHNWLTGFNAQNASFQSVFLVSLAIFI